MQMDNYEVLAELDELKGVALLRHKPTNLLYVQKKLMMYNEDVYKQLKANHHPNLANIIDYYKVDDTLYVIEEYINGKTLEDHMKDAKAVAPETAVAIMRAICHALSHLHNLPEPIIHRDIKLANVMIEQTSGTVKLIDFNISRFYKHQYTQDTTILGTEGYAAPEQFGFSQTDARSDIYACGIVLNYLLTGIHPKEYTYQGELRAVIDKCGHIDPEKRYENVGVLLQALSSIEAKLKEVVRPEKKVSKLPPGFRTKTRWKMILATLGYVQLILLIIFMESEYTGFVAYVDNFIAVHILLTHIFLFANYLNIQRIFPMFAATERWKRIATYFIFSPLIIFVHGLLAAFLSIFFSE